MNGNGSRAHVVVDARMIRDGGIGTYLRNVLPRVRRLRPHWRLTALGDPVALRAALGDADIAVRETRARIYSLREQVELPLRCPADADLYWAPHYNIPVLLRKPFVVTVHDVCHVAMPQSTGNGLRRWYASTMYRQVRDRARGILFDSEFSRSEMRRVVGEARGHLMVAPLAVGAEWFSAGSARSNGNGSGAPYLVYVGNMKRHKNVPALVRAFRAIADRIPHRLLLIGRREGLRADPELDREISRGDARVELVGELADDALRSCIAHADAFVTTSLYEGFGLPALEAMALGVPCVVSAAGSLPEVCADAALYCDPTDEKTIAARMLEIVGDRDLRSRIVARGRERAREFSWDRCAEQTAAVLEGALR